MAIYIAGGVVETSSTTATIELIPGREFEIRIWRVMPNPIEFSLNLDKGLVNKADQGECCVSKETGTPNLFVFSNPGAPVQVTLSSWLEGPVIYAAQPAVSYPNTFQRRMTADIVDGKPAFWQRAWEVSRTQFNLHSGLNYVRLKVISVDPALVGGPAQVFVQAPLSIKWAQPNNGWLMWGLILSPIFTFIQLVWASVLIVSHLIKCRRAKVAV